MADELQLRIHTELCKATVEYANELVAKHLKINEEALKDKMKVPIINNVANVIEEELASVEEEGKVTFLLACEQAHLYQEPAKRGKVWVKRGKVSLHASY